MREVTGGRFEKSEWLLFMQIKRQQTIFPHGGLRGYKHIPPKITFNLLLSFWGARGATPLFPWSRGREEGLGVMG